MTQGHFAKRVWYDEGGMEGLPKRLSALMEQVDGCHGPQVHVRRVLDQDLGVELEIAGGGARGP